MSVSKERKGKQTLSKGQKKNKLHKAVEKLSDCKREPSVLIWRKCILTVKKSATAFWPWKDIWSSFRFSIGKKCNFKWRESVEKRSTQIVWTVHFKSSKNTLQGSSEEKEAKRILQKQLSDERRVRDLKHQWYFTNDRLKTKIILNDF